MSFLKQFFGAKKPKSDGKDTSPETTVLVMPSGDAHTVPVAAPQILTVDKTTGAIVPLGQPQPVAGQPLPVGQALPMAQSLPIGQSLMEPRVRDSKTKLRARRILGS